MKAIILAAGLGTRLGELGKEIPKCLLEINGKSILETKIEMLRNLGLKDEDILVVMGNKGSCWTKENKEKIMSIAKNIVISYDNDSTSNSYSAKLGLDKIDEDDVMIIDGDLVISKELLRKMIETEGNLILSKESYDKENKQNKLLLNKEGKLLEMGKNIEKEKLSFPYLIYGAFMKIKKQDLSVLKEIINKEKYKTTGSDFLVNELSEHIDIRTITGNKWTNINKPEELENAKQLFSRNFVVLMRGHTFVGKSTIAREISTILGVDIYHSAVIRKELNLTPKTIEEADRFFDYRTGLREEVDKKVYGKLAENAEVSLKNNKSVILDGSYPFIWQRKVAYDKTSELNPEIFILNVICEDEEEIKKRLKAREGEFGSSPFHETPSWNTYLAIKEMAEPVEKNFLPEGNILNIIEYNSLTKKARLVQGKESENAKQILDALNSEKIIMQDENLNFIKARYDKIPELIKDKFVVVLDFDGVITSHSGLKTSYINEFGYNIKEEGCGHDACVRHGSVKEEDYVKARDAAQLASPDKLPLAKDFLENFSKLKKLKNTAIFILTSRYEHMLEHLENYMKHHKIKIKAIINTADKSKSEHLKNLNSQIFVDDSPFKLNNIFNELKDDDFLRQCSFMLFRTPENSPEANPDPNVIEVYDWNTLYGRILKKYENIFLKT